MMCVPGNIQVALTKEVYHVEQYRPVNPNLKRHRVECDICDVSLVVGSLQSHLEMQHGTHWSFVLNQGLNVERENAVYQATADAPGAFFYLVPACVGDAGSKAVL